MDRIAIKTNLKKVGDWLTKKKQDFLDWITRGDGRNVIARGILVSLIIILLNKSAFNPKTFWYLSISLAILANVISDETFDELFKLVVKLFLFFLSVSIVMAWIDKTKLFGTYEITDNAMLILVTSVYVYYTYRIIESNKQLFEKARLPVLVFHIGNNLELTIENASQDFIARRPKITLQFDYPRLTSVNPLKIKKWFSERKKNKIILDCPTIFPNSNKRMQYHRTIPIYEKLKEILRLQNNFAGQIEFPVTLICSYTTDQVEGEQYLTENFYLHLKVENGVLSIPPEYQLLP